MFSLSCFSGLSIWQSVLLCQLQHSISQHLKTCWECSTPHCLCNWKNIEEHQFQDRTLRDTTCHVSPLGHGTIGCNSLDVSTQPVPFPQISPPFKSMCLQSGDKNVMWNHTKGLTECEWQQFVFLCWLLQPIHHRGVRITLKVGVGHYYYREPSYVYWLSRTSTIYFDLQMVKDYLPVFILHHSK